MTTKPTTVAVLSADPIGAPVNPPLSAIHDASQQAKNLRQVLEEGKQRIGCFLGAGCPLGIYDAAEEKSMRDAIELIREALAQRIGARVLNGALGENFLRQVTVTVGGREEPARTVLRRTLSTLSAAQGGLRWRLFYDPESGFTSKVAITIN